jgi:hypothetical protein
MPPKRTTKAKEKQGAEGEPKDSKDNIQIIAEINQEGSGRGTKIDPNDPKYDNQRIVLKFYGNASLPIFSC